MFGHKRMPSREGGVEIVVEELSRRMAELGHDVSCINRRGHHVSGSEYDGADLKVYNGVKLKSVPTIEKKGLAAVSSSFFAAVHSAFSCADVVHIHAEGPALMCPLPKLFGKRVIVTVHGLDWQREKWKHGFGAKYIRWGEKMAVRFADEIIVLSKAVQDYFIDSYGRKTVLIPNGVTKPECAEAKIITENYGLKKGEYILFLGRLVPEKGVHYLIEAFKLISTNKKLVIAGGASDTEDYAAQLRQQAEGDERVIFTGFVHGRMLEELYSNAYVYVLPSDLEGMPLSLLEAMSYGCCCLTSNIPECADVLTDHGETFEKSDVAELGRKLCRLCNEPDTVDAYRKTVSDFICRKYNWDDVTKQTLNIYKRTETGVI